MNLDVDLLLPESFLPFDVSLSSWFLAGTNRGGSFARSGNFENGSNELVQFCSGIES